MWRVRRRRRRENDEGKGGWRKGRKESAREKKTYRRTRRERDVEDREALSSWSVLDPVPISRLVIEADSKARCYGSNGCEMMHTERLIVDERRRYKLVHGRRELSSTVIDRGEVERKEKRK